VGKSLSNKAQFFKQNVKARGNHVYFTTEQGMNNDDCCATLGAQRASGEDV
jgi:hypothetical protein